VSAQIAIVALGARTPVGLSAGSSAAAFRAGISRIGRVQESDDEDAPEYRIAADAVLGRGLSSTAERIAALGRSALGEVVAQLGTHFTARHVPVLMGLPEPRPGWDDDDQAQALAALSEVDGLRVAVEPLLLGHAAALEALRRAQQRLADGRWRCAIVGGVDSYLDPDAIGWLDAERQRLHGRVRSGLIPGEGAAFVALMEARAARAAGLPVLALVHAAATATESNRIKTDTICVGEGLTAAVQAALPADGVVDELYGDVNGERYRSEEWGFVALRLGAAFRDPADYQLPTASWGDAGAATGALNLVLATQALSRGYARGPRALIWGGSEAGLRAAVVLERA